MAFFTVQILGYILEHFVILFGALIKHSDPEEHIVVS